MKMNRLAPAALVLSCLLPPPARASGPKDYAGRWEIVLINTGTTFRSCALKLEEGGDVLQGEMVWRWGSVFPIRGKEGAVVNDKGELLLRGGEWDGALTLKRVGDALEGSARMKDGQVYYLFGTRAEAEPPEGSAKSTWGAPIRLLAQDGLAGWKPRFETRKFGWKCEDGVLTNSQDGDIDIVTERQFNDFQLHLEFKTVPHGNSGVYLRGRYEVQIEDDHGKPVEPHGMGAIYSRLAPRVNASKPAGEWQTYD